MIQNYVFIRRNQLPEPIEWQQAISEQGFDLRFPEKFQLPLAERTFISCNFEELQSGFDLSIDAYDESDFGFSDEERNVIGDADTLVIFETYSNAQEIIGMLIASAVLCQSFGGVMLAEFFEDDLLTGESGIELINSRIEGIRSQFSGPSKMRESRMSFDEDDVEVIEVEMTEHMNFDEIAESILNAVRASFSGNHEYRPADPNSFADVDLEYYESTQSEFEKLGFEFLSDVEDLTLTAQGDIETFIRVLWHPGHQCTASLYYIPAMESGIYELETCFSNNMAVVATTVSEQTQIAEWSAIHQESFPADTSPKDLLEAHRKQVMAFAMHDASRVELTNYDDLIASMNWFNRHKHDHLERIGWVTKDYLLAQTGGDETLAHGVYEAIQKILH